MRSSVIVSTVVALALPLVVALRRLRLPALAAELPATAIGTLGVYWLLYTIMFWLIMFGYWRELLALWVVPHILASALIIFFFASVTVTTVSAVSSAPFVGRSAVVATPETTFVML